jgi:hypothetical protein
MSSHGRDRGHECGRLNRLRGMHLETCCEGPSAIIAPNVAGQGNRWKNPPVFGFVLSNLPDQRIPVLSRQIGIAHQRVRTLRFEYTKRFAS